MIQGLYLKQPLPFYIPYISRGLQILASYASCETLPKPHLILIDRQLQEGQFSMVVVDFGSSDDKVARSKINVALAAIKLQKRVRTERRIHMRT